MVKKMTATEAEAKILAVLDEVATGQDVEITKHGKVVARLGREVGPGFVASADPVGYGTGDWTVAGANIGARGSLAPNSVLEKRRATLA
jgi:hypothetical protein